MARRELTDNQATMLPALLGLVLALQEPVQTTETSLGKKLDGEVQHSFTVSPDARHIAYAVAKDGKEYVVLDGLLGKGYTKLPRWPLTEAGIQPQIVFSPDGSRSAYVAIDDKRSFVVIDGVEGPAYDYIPPGAPRFSPNSKRIAYTARRGERSYAVVDGVESAPFDDVYDARKIFSRDGQHTLFEASRDKKNFWVLDGKEILRDEFHGHPAFSDQSGHISDIVSVGDKWVVYVDGKPGKSYDSIGNSVVFSPDFKHVLYQARDKSGDFLVVDGVEGKRFPAIAEASYGFAPDGKHYGFAVRLFKQAYVVRNDVKGETFEWVGTPEFSADSASIAYMAEQSGKRFVVQDDKRGEPFEQIGIMPRFSPVGKRLLYTGIRGGKVYLVVDQSVTPYDDVYGAEFSSDGKTVIYTARQGKTWAVYVNGVAGLPSESPYLAPMLSADGKRFAYLVQRGKKAAFVLDGREIGEYDEIGFMRFSPDGKHIFYAAKRGEKCIVVTDAVEGKTYDSFVFDGLPSFDSSGNLAFLAVRGNEYFRVLVAPRS